MLLPPIQFFHDRSRRGAACSPALQRWLAALRLQASEALGAIEIVETDAGDDALRTGLAAPPARHLDEARFCLDLMSAAAMGGNRFALLVTELESQVRAMQDRLGPAGLAVAQHALGSARQIVALDEESVAFCLDFTGRDIARLELPATASPLAAPWDSRIAVLLIHDREALPDPDALTVELAALRFEPLCVDLDDAAIARTEDMSGRIEASPLHIHVGRPARTMPGFRLADSLARRACVIHFLAGPAPPADSAPRDIEIRDQANGFVASDARQVARALRALEDDAFLRVLFQRNAGQTLLAFNGEREEGLLNWLKNSAQSLSTF
ncbi:MAG: hypothetical protein LDL22_00385 [Hyphomicrobiales bacterium]|nr:hypothetical protein [Hyphomicrobiales bacterium]